MIDMDKSRGRSHRGNLVGKCEAKDEQSRAALDGAIAIIRSQQVERSDAA